MCYLNLALRGLYCLVLSGLLSCGAPNDKAASPQEPEPATFQQPTPATDRGSAVSAVVVERDSLPPKFIDWAYEARPAAVLRFLEKKPHYSTNNIRLCARYPSRLNPTALVYSASNDTNLMQDYLIFYDIAKDSVTKIIDVGQWNPFLPKDKTEVKTEWIIQQLSGINQEIDATKAEVKGKIPPLLYDFLTDDYIIAATHIRQSALSDCYACPVIIWYSYDLLPAEEILEYVAYPGLSAFVVLDPVTGQLLGQTPILPFSTTSVTVDTAANYLLLAHMMDASEPKRNLQEGLYPWMHYVSVFSLAEEKMCYRDSTTSQYGIGIDNKYSFLYAGTRWRYSKTETMLETKVNTHESMKEELTLITDENVYVNVSTGYTINDLLLLHYPDGTEKQLDLNKDFEIVPLNCQ